MNLTKKQKATISLVLFIIMIIANFLGATGKINGLTQKEVSDMFRTHITPAPYAFSIWSVIYTLLAVAVVYGVFKSDENPIDYIIDNFSIHFWISSIFNIVWIVSFSMLKLEIATVAIIIMVLSLASMTDKMSNLKLEGMSLVYPLAFGLYTGWIFLATVLQIAMNLEKYGLQNMIMPVSIWSILTLLIVGLLLYLIGKKLDNAIFYLPISWGLIGVFVELKSPRGLEGGGALLPYIALAVALFSFALFVLFVAKEKHFIKPKIKTL